MIGELKDGRDRIHRRREALVRGQVRKMDPSFRRRVLSSLLGGLRQNRRVSLALGCALGGPEAQVLRWSWLVDLPARCGLVHLMLPSARERMVGALAFLGSPMAVLQRFLVRSTPDRAEKRASLVVVPLRTLGRCVGLEPVRQYAGNGGAACSAVEQDS
jgi:hypothetical protein